jgi:hypothetical protein
MQIVGQSLALRTHREQKYAATTSQGGNGDFALHPVETVPTAPSTDVHGFETQIIIVPGRVKANIRYKTYQ